MPDARSWELRIMVKTQGEGPVALLKSDAFTAEGVRADYIVPQATVERFLRDMDGIEGNASLSTVGQNKERLKVGQAAADAARSWHAKSIQGLDRIEASAQGSQMEKASGLAPLEPEAVTAMRTRLEQFSPDAVEHLYRTGDDREQRLIEAVARLTPRIGVRSGQGSSVRWVPFLNPDLVREVVERRTALLDLAAAKRLEDVALLRPAYKAIFTATMKVITDQLGRYGVQLDSEVVYKDPKTGAALRLPTAPTPS